MNEAQTKESPQAPPGPTLDHLEGLKPQWDAVRDLFEWLGESGYKLGGGRPHHRRPCLVHEPSEGALFSVELGKMALRQGEDNGGTPEAEPECICEEMAAECWGTDEQCPYADHHIDWVQRMRLQDRSEPLDRLLERYSGMDPQEVQRERALVLAYARTQNG